MELSFEQKREILEDGFTIVRGVVPDILIRQAQKFIHYTVGKEGGFREHTPHPAILDLFHKSPARQLVESVIGEGMFHPVTNAQVAIRYPIYEDPAPPPRPHLDGLLQLQNGVLQNFTALVGVLLNDLPEENAGNFTVWPGTHRGYEQYFRERGTDIVFQEAEFQTMHRSPHVALPQPRQIKGKAGDLVIAHYQLAHAGGTNVSHLPRYACYFRIDHVNRRDDWRAPLTDIWLHWPGIRDLQK